MPPSFSRGTMAQTPTISSVASSDISFDDLPAASDTGSQASEDDAEPYDDPNLVLRDIVKIRVEKKLFWFPAIYLTEGSPYFAKLLKTHDMSQTLSIRDADVSCLAFANLLQVLRTQLGMTPLSTLAEWMNVLHLSSKWGVTHFRTAAQQALLPLVSPVDKLVLARTYGFTDWISDAYVGLLEREDDLDEDDVVRMSPKDIVAIAKGRRQAGKTNARSRAEILRVMQSVLSPVDAPVTSAPPAVPEPLVAQKKAKTIVPTGVPLSGDAHALVSRWLDQVKASPAIIKACLITYMKEDHLRIPLVLDLAVQRAWHAFESYIRRLGSLMGYNPQGADIARWDTELQDLHHQCPKLGLFHSAGTLSAGLRFIDHWKGFHQVDLGQNPSLILTSKEWRTIVDRTLFLGRCTISDYSWTSDNLVDASIFSTLWKTMTAFFVAADVQRRYIAAQLLQEFLKYVNVCVTRVEVRWEMDAFYRVLEEIEKETQDPNLQAKLSALITSRRVI